MFGLSGVIIQINVIDVHIGHESSVGVCLANRLRIYRIGKTPWLAACLSAKRYMAGRSVSSGLCSYA